MCNYCVIIVLSPPVFIKRRACILLFGQLLLQSLVLAFVVTRDEDDDDEHQNQQPPGRGPHDDHQHVLVHLGFGGLCAAWKRGWGWGIRRTSACFFPLLALSSTCQVNLHHRAGRSHVVLRHAAVRSGVEQAQGSSESQRSIRVGGHTFWQLSTLSANTVASQGLVLL